MELLSRGVFVKSRRDSVDAANAAVLAELVVDPLTSEHTRVMILNILLQQAADKDFFRTECC